MKVLYCEAMVVREAVGYSPSARKPEAVVASWKELGVPLDVRDPAPASRADLHRAHDPRYVDGVLDGSRANGFGSMSAAVAASLPWTSGSMLSAAREALASGDIVASPTSGFHHAGWDHGGGFCTFNGLAVAALALRDERPSIVVGVLDADVHYGNGTDDIIRTLHLEGWIEHYTFGGDPTVDRARSDAWLARLPDIVRGFERCDVLLYQAGADPHVDDPLGGVLTTEQLHERDRIVFDVSREMSLPVAWNLAGGYQQPLRRVLDIHDNTLRAAFAASMRPRRARTRPP
jgi:acetoin utilization deacetylase AcuC-like enzyme